MKHRITILRSMIRCWIHCLFHSAQGHRSIVVEHHGKTLFIAAIKGHAKRGDLSIEQMFYVQPFRRAQ